jgi:TolB-like protein
MLGSAPFVRAPRLCRLLRFLVDMHQLGASRETSEYSIGVAVFDRDPASYSTGEDPIVRVQVGRLRGKLAQYDASPGAMAAVRITIPVGSYMPVIERAAAALAPPVVAQLALHPLRPIHETAHCLSFTAGLNEQLVHQMFKEFGGQVLLHGARGAAAGMALEGSVRVEGEALRLSVRLLHGEGGRIAWSGQFDRAAPHGIGLQDELASQVCTALAPHLRFA